MDLKTVLWETEVILASPIAPACPTEYINSGEDLGQCSEYDFNSKSRKVGWCILLGIIL